MDSVFENVRISVDKISAAESDVISEHNELGDWKTEVWTKDLKIRSSKEKDKDS